ncbi:DUF2220 domain-containing protein [Ureibacillus chungkukjangi]|uniref:Wadjet anti-phage system protein JetD domain-containing protein n=1 Tax=Ureibacillus chungkukjangi TaxID=1202712 RepID=UPI0020416715|nr:Wadjet anti-phage system protein JetD domain-containing protein [Ureibacillus chungkukjangi]MCM3388226.1 DUF2220 domain-containing protein [Ureibacillus chungkukjangi]
MRERIVGFKNSYITLDILEQFSLGGQTYEQFSGLILELEKEGVLVAVKNAGRNNKTPSLAYKYRINKGLLKKDIQKDIESKRFKLHSLLHLDEYFHLPSEEWENDYPYIEKINTYIEKYGLPISEVPAPERSLALVGDEKWIQEKGGQRVLERLKIWDELNIIPVSDPLAFIINPGKIIHSHHLHLIVENKTTFDGLSTNIKNTTFTTLIYGQGYKIAKSIEYFQKQLPLEDATHSFYYFGDLDWEGIKIWHQLTKKIDVRLAIPFYLASIDKAPTTLKTGQKPSEEAMILFLSFFEPNLKEKISFTLKNLHYWPQEVLSSAELKQVWSEANWIQG